MDERLDDDFGFVRRDSAVLERAIRSEGGTRGGSGTAAAAEQEAASGGGRQQGAAGQRRPTAASVARELPDGAGTPGGGPGSTRSVGKTAGLLRRMTSTPAAQQPAPTHDELPQSFQVKYLGSRDARGLWGIKHTRRPVDALVAAAKNLPPGVVLPLVKLAVSRDGVTVTTSGGGGRAHPIDTISYGVQDLVYTRVFSMIVVRETHQHQHQSAEHHPFECHAFVCDSRGAARRLTYALAAAFNEYSKAVKAAGGGAAAAAVRKKFAIDLRTPEEIEAELNCARPDQDSEA